VQGKFPEINERDLVLQSAETALATDLFRIAKSFQLSRAEAVWILQKTQTELLCSGIQRGRKIKEDVTYDAE